MMSYSLESVVELFKTEFSTFFADRKEREDRIGKFRCVEDVRNGMISIHSFSLDEDLDSSYNKFSEIMSKRFLRMKKCISESEHVLFLSNRHDSFEAFEKFLAEMHNLFDCNFTCLNVRHSDECYESSKKISERLEFVEIAFPDIHPNGADASNSDFWIGNPKGWEKVMQRISLSPKFSELDLAKIEDKNQK
jgi:hypothetical protein